MKVESVETDD